MQNQKPVVFVIGDSISIQYGPFLQELIKDDFCYDRKQGEDEALIDLDVPNGANGGDSGMVLRYIKHRLCDPAWRPALALVNCGLHDIKSPQPDVLQVPVNDYKNNLAEIVRLFDQHDIRLAWVRSTPVVDQIHNSRSKSFKRFSRDLIAYNAVADKIMTDSKVPLADLYTMTATLGNDAFRDHVHFIESVQRKQAQFLANFIRDLHTKGYFG
jgi:lysophospholipase L1-like esterase